MPFSEDRLELLVLKLGRPRSSTRRIHSPEMEAACELGGKLFEVVFGGDVRACLRSSLDEAYRKEGTGLRMKLRLQEVPLLSDLPWEFLLDTSLDRFFAQSNQTPIVRYIEMPERIKPITVNLPLHLLVMISSPANYLLLDVERERSRLQEALDPLIKAGKVRVKWLENPRLADLLHCLREGDYHIFHFIGHGGFDMKREEGVLVLVDEQGRGWLADAHQIGTILHDHPSLRLAVLNSCEGARNSLTDPFAGVAAGLIRQGVPAVVAMQFEITDEAAITFAGEFYAALAQGFPVDAAVAEARKAIYIQPNDIEWGTPVLYMRSSDGVLFDLTQKPESVQKPATEGITPPSTEPAAAPSKPETPEKLAKQGNSIGMKFTLIPAGEFYMGSEESDDEKHAHKVKINNPFYLGTYPVTQR
ncbi:MAG: CHAT domain-containing protein, partial [Proteobacteria bacterium]|nr:CHAT domain-containing protein [Pseudomonadota bacterium]